MPRGKYKTGRTICRKCFCKNTLEYIFRKQYSSNKQGSSIKQDLSIKLDISNKQDISNIQGSSGKHICSRKQTSASKTNTFDVKHIDPNVLVENLRALWEKLVK